MTAVPAPVSSTAAGALSAFLRGVERRALVVAELQCGDAARAEQTLVAVMRAFAAVASDLPMAQWPTRFWTLLGQRQSCASRWAASGCRRWPRWARWGRCRAWHSCCGWAAVWTRVSPCACSTKTKRATSTCWLMPAP